MEFYLDGSLLATDAIAPYDTTWGVSATPAGTFTIEAIALDASENTSSPDSVQVFVDEVIEAVDEVPQVDGDILPPEVPTSSPSNGSGIENRMIVLASASDETGLVEMTDYLDGEVQNPVYSLCQVELKHAQTGECLLSVES